MANPLDIALKHISLSDKALAACLTMTLVCVSKEFSRKYSGFRAREARRLGPIGAAAMHDDRVDSAFLWNSSGLYDRPRDRAAVEQALGFYPEPRPSERRLVAACVALRVRPRDFADRYLAIARSRPWVYKGSHDDRAKFASDVAARGPAAPLPEAVSPCANSLDLLTTVVNLPIGTLLAVDLPATGRGAAAERVPVFTDVLHDWCDAIVYRELPAPDAIFTAFDKDEKTKQTVATALYAVYRRVASPRLSAWYDACLAALGARAAGIDTKLRRSPSKSGKDKVLLAERRRVERVLEEFRFAKR